MTYIDSMTFLNNPDHIVHDDFVTVLSRLGIVTPQQLADLLRCAIRVEPGVYLYDWRPNDDDV